MVSLLVTLLHVGADGAGGTGAREGPLILAFRVVPLAHSRCSAAPDVAWSAPVLSGSATSGPEI